MSKLRKITPLDRHIDILEQHIKRCELELQKLYDLRPRERKKKQGPIYDFIKDLKGKKHKIRVGLE